MPFFEEATGHPAAFLKEAGMLHMQFPHLISQSYGRQFCAFAGAAYIAELAKMFVSPNGMPNYTFERKGTASIYLPGHNMYLQAVNDRYTERWPLHWIVGGDRKKLVGYNMTLTQASLYTIVAHDLEALAALYLPKGTKVPEEIVCRYNDKELPDLNGIKKYWRVGLATTAATQQSMPSMPSVDAIDVVFKPDRAVSPVQLVCLDYPYKAPLRAHAYLGPAPQATVVSGEPQATGERPKTLAEIVAERKKQALWNGEE